jgi:calmodulin
MAGDLEPEFRAELEEAFRLFDREGDGQIETKVEHCSLFHSVQELCNVLRSLGQQTTREEVELLVLRMDTDHSGAVDLAEFLVVMAARVGEEAAQDEVELAFRVLDKDGDGRIGRDGNGAPPVLPPQTWPPPWPPSGRTWPRETST